jgi:hypothetical protein
MPVTTRRWRKPLLISAATVALAGILAAVALATSTYEYCSGCTINAGSSRTSAATRFAVLSYEHRLSGPASGVTIRAEALNTGGGLVCSNSSSSVEVTCSPGGTEVYGRAWNLGAGNYGFNAHLSY